MSHSDIFSARAGAACYGTGLAVGEVGAQQRSSFSGALAYRPYPDLQFALSGSWTKSFPIGCSFDEGTDAVVAGISARYQLTRWLSASLTYQFGQSKFRDG